MKRIIACAASALLLCVCVSFLFGCALFGDTDNQTQFYVDGRLYETVEHGTGESATVPQVPDKDGYTFDGWYADAAGTIPYDNGTQAYAFFRPIPYTLTYDLDGGESDNPTVYTIETDAFSLRAPTKPGYTFVGWTTAETSVPQTTVTINKGTMGDMELKAHYTPTVYTITYDLGGGTTVNPVSYTIETESFTLTPPQHDDYAFLAWEKDGALYQTYTVEKGTYGALNFRAVWRDGLPVLSYRADIDGVPVASTTAAGSVSAGTRLTVTAPAVYGDRRFVGWTCNGTYMTSAPSYTFTMGNTDSFLVACYDDAYDGVYDKAVGGDFTVLTGSSIRPLSIQGGGANQIDDVTFSSGKVVLKEAYLADLPCGYYTYYIETYSGGEWITLSVTDSRRPTDVALVYDTNAYPAVVLMFNCTCRGEHTYSLDGGSAVRCKSGDVVLQYNKAKDHTVTVSCVSGTGTATVTKKGYVSSCAAYYEQTFVYGGNTYDYVIETEEECGVFYEYLLAVRGVLDVQSGKELSYDFLFGDNLAAVVFDKTAYGQLTERIFNTKSFPMGPTAQLSYMPSLPCEATLQIAYPDGLNGVVSSQEKLVLTDTSDLQALPAVPASRTFPIDAFPQSEVRTVYELELLPYGLCPTFADPYGDAARLYGKAREVLSRIVSDTMTEYQKVFAIYRYLANTVTYDTVAASSGTSIYRSYTSYGALMDGIAVCDGYASAFRLMCLIEGIRCEERSGRTDPDDPSTGHAWNTYTIDGVTYACDATWSRVSIQNRDGSEGALVTMYYAMMDQERLMETGHFENAFISAPYTAVCADAVAEYYTCMGTTAGHDLVIDSYAELEDAVALAMEADVSTLELRTTVSTRDINAYIEAISRKYQRSFSSFVQEDRGVVYLLLTE